MYCAKCGTALVNGKCPACGRTENPNINLNNNPSVQQPVYVFKEQDSKSAGYSILSFFIPLIGLILYCVWKDQFPIRAKECGKWALINVGISLFLFITIFFISVFISIASV